MASGTVSSKNAVFDRCPDRSVSTASTKPTTTTTLETTYYCRTNWDGVDLPREPSLKLVDDDCFFQLIGSYHPNDTGSKRRRYLDFVRGFTNLSACQKRRFVRADLEDGVVAARKKNYRKKTSRKHTSVPFSVRKQEIELVQRGLPRHPSQTHLSKPSFYPLPWSKPSRITSLISGARSRKRNYNDAKSDDSVDFFEDESEFFADYCKRKEEESLDVDPELDGLQLVFSENIKHIDEEERRRRLGFDDENSASTSTSTSTSPHTHEAEEESLEAEPAYEPKIGVVSLPTQAMILQAKLEARCRTVPEDHKIKFLGAIAQASALGQFTRLREHTIEAYGQKIEKYEAAELPSATWVKGNETVVLPAWDPARAQFQIFREAVALGGIKALKPTITTNYGQVVTRTRDAIEEDHVDVDDASKPKYMRTKYLTDLYLHSEQRKWSSDNETNEVEQRVWYQSLDDVELPTDRCPVRRPVATNRTHAELRESISRQVAEKVWERRYRLERPRAQQRITTHCSCKFCNTSSPYQTLAYRKRWLVQQNLWNEPPPNEEAVCIECVSENGSDSSQSFATEEVEGLQNSFFKMFKLGGEKTGSGGTSLDRPTTKLRGKLMDSLLGLSQHSKDRKERLEKVRKERLEKSRNKRSELDQKQASNERGLFGNGMRSLFSNTSHHRRTKSN